MMNISKIKKSGQLFSAITLANLFVIGMVGCSDGKSGNNDIDFTVYTISKSVQVIDGDLTECRVVDSNGHVAVEESPSNYVFTFEESETLGELSATDCKEASSGLRFNVTMSSNSQTLITPLTTYEKENPDAFATLVSLTGETESDLLGVLNSSELLKISNVISSMYSMESINEFSTLIPSATSLYSAARDAIDKKYEDIADANTKLLIDLITAIENTTYDDSYFTKIYDVKKYARLLYQVPALNVPKGKVALVIIDTKNQVITDAEITISDDINVQNSEGVSSPREFLGNAFGLASFYFEGDDNIIKVSVKKGGFLDSGVQINPKDINGTLTKTIKLVSLDKDNLASGVGLEQEDITTSVDIDTGYVNKVIELVVNNESSESNTTLKVSLPVGTQLLDADNNPVTGTLKSTIVSFAAGDDNTSAYESFPGGFEVRAAAVPDLDENGTETNSSSEQDVSFQSAGFVSIQIADEEGNKVKNFGKAIEIAMEIPKTMINPSTLVAMVVGDSVPIWNYNEDKGEWAYQGEGDVTDINSTDNWGVTFTTTHLTYFNMDWYRADQGRCSEHKVKLAGAIGNNVSLKISTAYNSKTIQDNDNLGLYTLKNPPLKTDLIFEVMYENVVILKEVYKLESKDDCTKANYNDETNTTKYLEYDLTGLVPASDATKKNLNIIEQCENGTNNQPLEGVYLYKIDNGRWGYQGISASDGVLEVISTDNSNRKIYAWTNSNRHKIRTVYTEIESGDANQTIAFTLADKYCATASSQIISMDDNKIVFLQNGISEQNSTIIRKVNPADIDTSETVTTTLEKIIYAMSRIEFNAIEENIDVDVAKLVTNGVVGMNIRKLDSNEINMNLLFSGINYGANYKLMDIGDPYILFVETEDEGDVFINGKIDKLYEEATLTRSSDTKSWTFIPYNILYEDILSNDRFTEVEDKLNDSINDEADMEITFFFNDNLPLKDFYAKDKATNILHTNYDDVIEALCGKGETDCSVKYFKTIVNIKNAE